MDHINKATSLWLVRHGEPAAEKGICCVSPDTGLSETGVSQMACVAEYLKAEPVAAVYGSPLRRALESARIIASVIACPLEVVPDLRELEFGDFAGLAFDEIAKRDPEFCQVWMNKPASVTFPNGESYRDMRLRVLKSAEAIRRERAGQASVIVSHAGVNRILIAYALDLPASRLSRLGQDHAAVNLLQFFEDIASVQLLNYSPVPQGTGEKTQASVDAVPR